MQVRLGSADLLRPRMERVVHLLEPRVVDVRVDLRRGDARVAEHFLHLPQDRRRRPSRCVAKVWRSECGLSSALQPASFA